MRIALLFEEGSAIAQRLAQDGLEVLVHANQGLERAQAVVDRILAAGGRARALRFDVTDRAACAAALAALTEEGAVQVLVNNAGVHDDAVFPGMTGDQWDRVLDVSLNGFFNVTQPLMLPMIRTRWGRVINITSVSGVLGNRGQVNYSAAKAALHAAGRSLALEVAARGITVNAVCPGYTETDILRDSIANVMAKTGRSEAQARAEFAAGNPQGRIVLPEEVAQAVCWLCAPGASAVTGQAVSVSGGEVM